MAGPLIPQWVMSNGPVSLYFVPSILTSTFAHEVPGKSLILLSWILKVNKEGTGRMILCPIEATTSQIFWLDPRSNNYFFATYHRLIGKWSSNPWSTAWIFSSEWENSMCTSNRFTSRIKHSTMDIEESDTGNTRWSSSTLRGYSPAFKPMHGIHWLKM